MAGRPKKIVLDATTPAQAPTNLTHVSLGVAANAAGQWGLVRIPFNPTTGEVGQLKFEVVGNSKNEASEKFKITGYSEGILA